MAEPFRNLLDPALVRTAAQHLARVWPAFDGARFTALVLPEFAALAMKARAMRIADALEATLPPDFADAAQVIEASLRPVRGDEALSELRSDASGLAGWVVWALGEYVARRGLNDPDRALRCLHALTRRFTAEFAIRPLLIAHPDRVYATLERWLDDPSEHVRRLVSEGSRPRLPWGLALRSAIGDPSPAYPLLRVLQDDPSAYVRRSVANHLNDIGREHPDRLVAWLVTHLPGASAQRRALLRHASRMLIKRGHPEVLAAWGLGQAFDGVARLSVAPLQLRVGESLELDVQLHNTARAAQTLVVDYAVHHVRADGSTAPKVFKGWNLQLAAGETRSLQRRHSLKPITTRRYYPGLHRVELQVNGQVVASAAFALA